MTPGKRKVSAMAVLMALVSAGPAGHRGEVSFGLEGLAAATSSTIALPCHSPTITASLVFERIHTVTADDRANLLADGREMVRFDWNPVTGELRYRIPGASLARRLLSDPRSPSTPGVSADLPNCGSR